MDIMEQIKQQIEGNAIILYMKGSPNAPQCGFSARTVEALMQCGERFAYVDILAVSSEFEGRGVGRALLSHVEQWARERDFVEVVLDVFAGNAHAIAFYTRLGYAPDHIRLAKPLD